ncbi:MAG: PAS domain-containing protein [Parvibaculum sp.]
MGSSGALQLRPLNLFIDPTLQIVDARLTEMLAYWKTKRQGAQLPRRADVSPAELVAHLPRLALLNVTGEGTDAKSFNVRLSGTGIDDLLGHDHRGQRLDQILPNTSGKLVAAALTALVTHKRPMRFFAQARLPGNPQAALEGIALPLVDEDGHVNMVLIETVSIRRADMARFTELRFENLAAVAS